MGRIKFIAIFVIAFIIGWLSFDLYNHYSNINLQQPFSFGTNELKSPGDWIQESQVKITANSITINQQNLRWARIADTNSMDPVIDKNSNSIELKPKKPSDLQTGDIISFKTDYGTIIHRIVQIGNDPEGWYAVTKGDNNKNPDPYKVRFNQIKGVVVAVLY